MNVATQHQELGGKAMPQSVRYNSLELIHSCSDEFLHDFFSLVVVVGPDGACLGGRVGWDITLVGGTHALLDSFATPKLLVIGFFTTSLR
jgi:hypothetical protein